MKLKRINSSKGQRWKKGQSCISNPGNNKFRELAQGNFFKKLDGESGLTVDALAKHTAALAVEPRLCADSADDKSVGCSFNTFATNFTTCTIPAFQKFFKNISLDSEMHTRMLAIHAAAQEYIVNSGLTESSTSYMCALMTSLEGVKEAEADACATLSLLAKVIRKVSRDVLRMKFGEYSKLLNEIFSIYAQSSNIKILINVIGCLSHLLRAQDELQWNYPYTGDILHRILSFTMHENVDLRRSAQYNVAAILRASAFMQPETCREDRTPSPSSSASPSVGLHPSAEAVGLHLLRSLKLASQQANGKSTLLLLIFLQQIIICFPEKIIEQCCGRVLGVMHVGDAVICSRSLKVFKALFCAASDPCLNFSSDEETREALLNALTSAGGASTSASLKVVPGPNHAELAAIWMDTVAEGVVSHIRLNNSKGVKWFVCWTKQLVGFWKSDHLSVHEKVWHTIDYVVDEGIKKIADVSPHVSDMIIGFKVIENGLSLQYKDAWPFVFKSLCPFFELLGQDPSAQSCIVDCVKNLSLLMQTDSVGEARDLEKAVGTAIESVGSRRMLSIIPIRVTGDIAADEKPLWILPLLRKHVRNASLKFFREYFVPLTRQCREVVAGKNAQLKSDALLVKTYEQIEWQIWALLPSFSKGACDVDEALSATDFARLLCDHVRSREDTRLNVLAALRAMMACEPKSKRLVMYADKYFKALVNVYLHTPRNKAPSAPRETTVDAGHRVAAHATLKLYLPLLNPTQILEFFNLLSDSYENEKESLFRRKAFLSLIRLFIPYLNAPYVEALYMKAKFEIEYKMSLVQKIAYRIIEDILESSSEACQNMIRNKKSDILDSLERSSKFVSPPSLSARLGCFRKLLPHVESSRDASNALWKVFVGESVKFCGTRLVNKFQKGSINSMPTRKAAFALLLSIGESVRRILRLESDAAFETCYDLLPPLQPSSDVTPNILHAISVLVLQYKEVVSCGMVHRVVEDASVSLRDPSRLTIKAALKLIRGVFSHFSAAFVSDAVDVFMRELVAVRPSSRGKFRDEIRDIIASLSRKFGADRIRALIPENDLLRVVLKNVLSKDRHKKRLGTTTSAAGQERDTSDGEDNGPSSLDHMGFNNLAKIMEEIDREIENDLHKPKSKLKNKTKTSSNAPNSDNANKQAWIKEDEGEILDLLDFSSGQNITSKKPRPKKLRFQDEPRKSEEEKYGFKFDQNSQKFIITDCDDEESDPDDRLIRLDDATEDGAAHARLIANLPAGTDKRKRTASQGSDESTSRPTRPERGAPNPASKRARGKFDHGKEFRSSKAGGDVQRKSGVSPFAYVQFSKESMNKRKKSKYAGQFKSLVRGAKKGAAIGLKAKRKIRK